MNILGDILPIREIDKSDIPTVNTVGAGKFSWDTLIEEIMLRLRVTDKNMALEISFQDSRTATQVKRALDRYTKRKKLGKHYFEVCTRHLSAQPKVYVWRGRDYHRLVE